MRSVSIRLRDLDGGNKLIPIGFQGENEYTTVNIDCKIVFDQHPNAIPALAVTPPKGDSYPAIVVRDGDIISWTVCDSDLIYEGSGELQLTFVIDGTVIGKTYKARTKILGSIEPSGEVPTPIQNWLTQAAAALQALPQEVSDAVVALMGAMVGVGETLNPGENVTVNYDTATNTLTIGVPRGADGQNGQDGHDGRDGVDGHTPVITANKVGDTTTIYVDGTAIAEIKDGESGTGLIDDNAGVGDTDKVLSADKVTTELNGLKNQIHSVTPESFGAKGDGVTDDSEAVQAAVDAGYEVYFASNKTYYLESEITIDHDCHIYGGENTVIKTKTPTGGTVNNAFVVTGTLKKETTLTSDYKSTGNTDNAGNQFKLDDMNGISIGDIMIITAEDQYYSYSRQYYYLGGVLLISDIYNEHLYTSNSMPWDIENTENVSVKIYDAPTVIFENLHFVSDLDSMPSWRYFIDLQKCKNSVVRNCTMTEMPMGMRIYNCVNTLVDCVTVSKSKHDNSIFGDGYGIHIYSSSETIVKRVLAICAQGCVDLGGTIPNINTHIRNCNLTSECRAVGIDMHENSYNIVIEDCTLGGLSLYGTAVVNRCRFIRNNRSDAYGNAITFRGNHNPNWATLKVSNCVFDGDNVVRLDRPYPQEPIQSFANIFGNVEITECTGGYLAFNPDANASVIENVVKRIVLKDWVNCVKFYHTSGNIVEYMRIENCTFTDKYFVNGNNNSHGVYLDYIRFFDYSSADPMIHKIHADKPVNGYSYILPENVNIQLSSSNPSTAKYVICGLNTTPNVADDYLVGNISGSVGSNLSRSIATASNAPTVSIDGNGNIVYSQNTSKGNYSLSPVGLLYAKEPSTFSISATLKNTGATDPASFYPYIAIVDCETGKILYRGNGNKQTATAQGIDISHSYDVYSNCVVIGYFYCSTAVANSESTFENMKIELVPKFAPPVMDNEPYTAKRMTGDGTIKSLDGVNNIMSYESTFNIKFNADLLSNS